MSRLPLLPDSVSASFLPSGDQAGAPLMPARADTMLRLPLRTSWTYTAETRRSNDTYASQLPSADQAGDISGRSDCRIMRGFSPSASATISW